MVVGQDSRCQRVGLNSRRSCQVSLAVRNSHKKGWKQSRSRDPGGRWPAALLDKSSKYQNPEVEVQSHQDRVDSRSGGNHCHGHSGHHRSRLRTTSFVDDCLRFSFALKSEGRRAPKFFFAKLFLRFAKRSHQKKASIPVKTEFATKSNQKQGTNSTQHAGRG